MHLFKFKAKKSKGASISEFGLLAGLLVITVAGASTALFRGMENVFSSVSQELATPMTLPPAGP